MQLSRFPAGESSLRQNARDVSETDTLSLSLPSSPRCRDIVVTAIASERERGQRCSSRVLLPRCSSTFVCLSPSATESTSSIDRSRKIDFTKRNALWFHRSNEGEGGILSCRSDEFLSFSSLPLLSIRSPLRCHERDHEGVAIATSNSIRPPFPSPSRRGDSLSSRPSSSFDCLCPASGLASGSRQRLH